jgi:hypothetical protein
MNLFANVNKAISSNRQYVRTLQANPPKSADQTGTGGSTTDPATISANRQMLLELMQTMSYNSFSSSYEFDTFA